MLGKQLGLSTRDRVRGILFTGLKEVVVGGVIERAS